MGENTTPLGDKIMPDKGQMALGGIQIHYGGIFYSRRIGRETSHRSQRLNLWSQHLGGCTYPSRIDGPFALQGTKCGKSAKISAIRSIRCTRTGRVNVEPYIYGQSLSRAARSITYKTLKNWAPSDQACAHRSTSTQKNDQVHSGSRHHARCRSCSFRQGHLPAGRSRSWRISERWWSELHNTSFHVITLADSNAKLEGRHSRLPR